MPLVPSEPQSAGTFALSATPFLVIAAEGTFEFEGAPNKHTQPSKVIIEQLECGRTFLHCDDLLLLMRLSADTNNNPRFVGRTNSGIPITTSPLIAHIGLNCYVVTWIRLGSKERDSSSIRAHLTNLIVRNEITPVNLHFPVSGFSAPVSTTITAAARMQQLHLALKKSPHVRVTASISIDQPIQSEPELDRVLRACCNALSLVQGRRVNWIAREGIDQQGKQRWLEFGSTKTKDYSSGALCFDPNQHTAVNLGLEDAPDAISCLEHFYTNYDQDDRILNAWLDARSQSDYLEGRTLKFVVVIESLCHRVTPARMNFKQKLSRTLETLGIRLAGGRVEQFCDVRNRIIHDFRYLEPSEFDGKTWGPSDIQAQHYAVAAFVDEVILRVFGLGRRIDEFQQA